MNSAEVGILGTLLALVCLAVVVEAFRREGRPIRFTGNDFRKLISHDEFAVDWVTGTVTNLTIDSSVVEETHTSAHYNPQGDSGTGDDQKFRERTASSTASEDFSIEYEGRHVDVSLTATTGNLIKFHHFQGLAGKRMTVVWLTKRGERRGHYYLFLNHALRNFVSHPVVGRTEQALLAEPEWGAMAAVPLGWLVVGVFGGGFLLGIIGAAATAGAYILASRAKRAQRRQDFQVEEMGRFMRFLEARQPADKDSAPADVSTFPGAGSWTGAH